MPIPPQLLQALQPYLQGLTIDPQTGKITNIQGGYTDSSGHSGIDPNNPFLPVSGDPRRNAAEALQMFSQSGFNNPTSGQISQALNAPNDQTLQAMISNMIGQNQAQQGASDIFQKDLSQLQPILDQQRQNAMKYYTDPSSQGYQQLAGNLNNSGIFNSGAFSSQLANILGNVEGQNMAQIGSQAFQPMVQAQEGMNAGSLQELYQLINAAVNQNYGQYNQYTQQQFLGSQQPGAFQQYGMPLLGSTLGGLSKGLGYAWGGG